MDSVEKEFFIKIKEYLESASETAGEVVQALEHVAGFLDGIKGLPNYDSGDIQALSLALRMQSSATKHQMNKAQEIASQIDKHLLAPGKG